MNLAYGLASFSVVPMRATPSHRAEQVSQLLFGERLEVLAQEKDGWLFVRGEWDQYEGWIKERQVSLIPYKIFRKKSNMLSAGNQDFILLPEGKFLLSPGSDLFQMRRREMLFGNREFLFRGKKISLKTAHYSKDQLRHWSTLFVGSPYQWGGRNLMGVDCSGLTQIVFKMMGKPLPRDAWQQAEGGMLIDFLQSAHCGDLAFFDNEEGRIVHVGILLDQHTIIHASEHSGGVVIDAIDNGGIISRQMKVRTHRLRLIKRYFEPDPVVDMEQQQDPRVL
jgi:hypothetical protein